MTGIVMVEVGGRGGVADYTQELSAALAAGGTPVTLVTARDHRYRPVPGVAVAPVIPWVRGTTAAARAVRRAGLGPAVNAVRFAATLPRIVRLARRGDVVHLQGHYFPPLAALLVVAVRAAGVPVVYTAHNTFDRGRGYGPAHRVLHACARTTIVHTGADLARLPAGVRAVAIPHGEYGALARAARPADPERAREELGVPDGAVAVLLFGQLRPDKGVGDLLAAVERTPGVHAIIAGEDTGGLRGVAPGRSERVTVEAGFVPVEDVGRLFAAADTVVLPYRVASQSGVLLLAYAFRRPVVAYPSGGLAEAVIPGETGWLTERADPDALAATLAEVAAAGRAECARRGSAGERLARERYAWPAIARATEAVYRAASSERTAAV